MRIGLFEDTGVAQLAPLTDTRAAFDLLCGLTTLAAKQCRHFGFGPAGLLVRPALADLVRLAHPTLSVNDPAWLKAGPAVLVNGRWLPPPRPADLTDGPHVGTVDGQLAYALVDPDQLADVTPANLADAMAGWLCDLPQRPGGGRLVNYPWELVDHNAEQIILDFQTLTPGEQAGWRPASFHLTGPAERLLIDPTARLEPLVMADTTCGPVVIDRDAVVHAFSRLEGPCYVGPGTVVRSARLHGGTTIGRSCRVGGEIEASVIQGHTNKAHDGFLGHSYLGEWVNVGAGTHASDLRLDYAEVRVPSGLTEERTGLRKVGCFVGDHVKAGLSVLVNSGTRVGSFSQLLPTGKLAPRLVPPFCRATANGLVELSDLDRLFVTATEVLRRRGAVFTAAHRAAYRALFERSAEERRLVLRDAEARRRFRAA